MKKVTFGQGQNNSAHHRLLEIVKRFLVRNGVSFSHADESVTLGDDDRIFLRPHCSNSSFTKGFALLQLLFSEGATNCAFIKYNLGIGTGYMALIPYDNEMENTIKYIESHMDVTIEF